jgi:hypothetical protein
MADHAVHDREPALPHRAPCPRLGGRSACVVVAAAGLVGLTLALDLAQRGVR